MAINIRLLNSIKYKWVLFLTTIFLIPIIYILGLNKSIGKYIHSYIPHPEQPDAITWLSYMNYDIYIILLCFSFLFLTCLLLILKLYLKFSNKNAAQDATHP